MSLLRPAARRLAWALVLPASLFAVAAWAGVKEDMKAMSAKFLAARSYHATMINSDKRVPKTEMDFVAPDRYRMDSGMGPQIVIGDTMYMTVGGNTMKIPMPKGMLTQWRQADRAFREIDRAQIEDLGSETVDGKPAKKYRMVQTFDGVRTDTLLWVGANGLPAKMETTGTVGKRSYTTTIVYSRFNDPSIRIDAPR
jgi:outer membrane lipoprotein-sorting protein